LNRRQAGLEGRQGQANQAAATKPARGVEIVDAAGPGVHRRAAEGAGGGDRRNARQDRKGQARAAFRTCAGNLLARESQDAASAGIVQKMTETREYPPMQ